MRDISCPKCKSNTLVKWGYIKNVKCISGKSRQRYKCMKCNKGLSQNTGNFSFRSKKNDPALNSKIFQAFIHGLSNRKIARFFRISEHCVRLRLDRMAKKAFLFHSDIVSEYKIRESIAYDGLENFSGSQYDPNNIQHAIGAESLFIYDFNFAPLNRKGRTSVWQKNRLAEIEAQFGRYMPSAIRVQSAKIFKRIHKMASDGQLELLSDEHFQYKRALAEIEPYVFKHLRISSKACRNFQNILFSVNHTDLLIRNSVAAFERETISFSKTAGRMCQKYMLFMLNRNYMVPQFTKKHVRRPKAHLQSPAQALNLCDRLLGFKDIFVRYPVKSIPLNEDWDSFYDGNVPYDCVRSIQYKRRVT